uniref:Ras-GEF domain-containing protein n=1 Tax=Arcella intermedia TaxID=1963864 RepID=A0A6B2KXG8_9EUKA
MDFSVADSEMNIVYTETEDKQKTVKCATFSKLIEKLTNSDYIQIDPVLLTYRTYCTPLELLGALLERYEEAGSEETASLIRLKIFNVLRRWIQFGSDFDSEEKVKDTTLEFLSKLLQSEEKTQLAQDMIRRIEKSKKSVIKNSRIGTTGPELLLPSDVNVNVMLFPPEEIARQITISEWKIWEAIKPWEFLDLKWQKPNKKELAPNILAFTERFNYINAWVATTVCLTENFKSRVKIIKRFIDIAMALRQLRNFNGMMEICSGLTRGPVNRLKKTFAALSKNYQNKREELLKITEPQHSYKSLRELICSADPPLVPYLGMYLTDLTFIEEGNKTLLPITVEDKTVLMINYKKSRLVSETLSRIQMYQQKPYELKSFAPLQDKLKNLKVITDENVLYTVSEYLEPRHNQEQPPRPSILDSLIEISLPDYKKNLEFELEVEWLFDEPDAPSNIVFDEAEQIVSATLPKLIEKLTHHETPDVKSQIPFLSNFTYVVSPDELLDLLIERFRVPLPLDQSPQTLDKFEKTIKGPIELRVYNLVKNWVSFFWCDFQREELITKLMDFITSDLLETDKKTAGALQKLLEKKRGGTIEGLLTLPASNNESLNLLAIEPLEIAKQLTLEAYTKVYIPINPRQLVEESMMKSYSVVDSLLKKIDLEAIINKMKSKNGFELKDRRKKKSLKQYPKCFIGQEAVTWLSCQLLISREDAVLLGKHLQEKGVIDHVSSKAEFGDNELFYKFPTKKNSTSLFYDKQTFGFATTPQMGPLRRACMEHLLRIKNWVLFELVNTKNLQFMFQIAKELLKLNNWHSLHSMIAALDEHSKIPKFKDAWEKLSNEDQQFFNTTKEIFLDSESFIQRNIHLVSPSLPSLLALLTSIEQKMEASGPIKFTENLVNVKRLLSIGSVVDSFLGIQTSHPIYEPIPLLQAYLSASHQPVKLQLKK